MALAPLLACVLGALGCQSGEPGASLADQRAERAALARVEFMSKRDEARRLAALDLWRQGDVAGCAAHLEELCARNPSDPAIHAHLAELAWSQGDLERAEAEYRAAVDLAPEQPELQHALALVLIDAGRADEAQGYLARTSFDQPAGNAASQPATAWAESTW